MLMIILILMFVITKLTRIIEIQQPEKIVFRDFLIDMKRIELVYPVYYETDYENFFVKVRMQSGVEHEFIFKYQQEAELFIEEVGEYFLRR